MESNNSINISENQSLFESLMQNENLFVFRAMFYLLMPSETYFKEEKDVPDLTTEAVPLFFVLIFIEQIVFLIKNGRFNGRVDDIVTSVAAGMVHALPKLVFREISIAMYVYIYENFRFYDLPWDSVWTYIFTLLFVDMGYYWFHRAAHEINLFWAAHQTHHSSEDYNLSTALRQSIFQKYTSWFFYLPLAFFVKPSIYMIHSHMNLLFQFWIHTELVDSIGPLEYILNTASHHRVHHGRNPYCIDKNYAGVFIIWDRMFGTFEAEKKEEKIAYGLVHPINSFDPIYVQVFNYEYLFKRFFSSKSISEAFSVLFKGPGWVPGSGRLGNPQDLPQIEYPIKVYSKNISNLLNIYIVVNFGYVVIAFSEFMKELEIYPAISLSMFVFVLLYSLSCFGFYFDSKPFAVLCDSIRCMILVYLSIQHSQTTKKLLLSSDLLFESFKFLNIFSLVGLAIYTIALRSTTTTTIINNVTNKENVYVRKPKRA